MSAGTRRFATAAIEGVVAQALSMALSIGWVYIVAHALDAVSVGRVLYAMAATNTAVAFFSLGLHHAFAVEARDAGDAVLVSNALIAILLTSLAVGLVSWAVQVVGLRSPDLRYASLPLLPFVCVPYFAQILATTLLRALHAFRRANICSLLVFLIFNVALIATPGALGLELSTPLVLVAFSGAASTACVVTIGLLFATARPSLRLVSANRMRSLFRFGGQVHIGNAFKELMYRADLYLVGGILGPAAAGVYGVVLRLIEAAARMVDAVGLIIVPLIARGSERERRRISYLSLGIGVPVVAGTAIVIAAAADLIVQIMFGLAFASAAPLLRSAVFALIPLTVWKILANDLIARGATRLYIASAVAGGTLICALNVALLARYGLSGAVIILTFAYSVPALMLVVVVRAKLGYSVAGLFRETGAALRASRPG